MVQVVVVVVGRALHHQKRSMRAGHVAGQRGVPPPSLRACMPRGAPPLPACPTALSPCSPLPLLHPQTEKPTLSLEKKQGKNTLTAVYGPKDEAAMLSWQYKPFKVGGGVGGSDCDLHWAVV